MELCTQKFEFLHPVAVTYSGKILALRPAAGIAFAAFWHMRRSTLREAARRSLRFAFRNPSEFVERRSPNMKPRLCACVALAVLVIGAATLASRMALAQGGRPSQDQQSE